MLIDKEIEVILHSSNMAYYETLGYEIPRRLDKFKRMSVPKGSKIVVKTLDLQERSMIEINLKCDFCGKEFKRQFSSYISSRNHNKENHKDACNDCTGRKISDILTVPIESVIIDIREHNYKILNGIDTYINQNSKLSLECPNGHLWNVSYIGFKKNYECPECKGFKIKTYEEIYKYYQQNGCLLLTTKEEYKNTRQKLRYRCKCGNTYAKDFASFQRIYCCDNCNPNKKGYNTEKVKNILLEFNYTLLSDYKNSYTPLDYICDKGHYSSSSLLNLLKGARCSKCFHENHRKENHPMWNPNLTQEERIENRKYFEYQEWRKKVFERDNYTCQCCGDNKGHNLNAHHKDSYDWSKERRLDVDNGITLCDDCHSLNENSFHKVYGFGKNTEVQYNEWTQQLQKVVNTSEPEQKEQAYAG